MFWGLGRALTQLCSEKCRGGGGGSKLGGGYLVPTYSDITNSKDMAVMRSCMSVCVSCVY